MYQTILATSVFMNGYEPDAPKENMIKTIKTFAAAAALCTLAATPMTADSDHGDPRALSGLDTCGRGK